MIIPTIHLNGTSKQRLIDDLVEAGSAIQLAQKALAAAGPNGRDYYPQGPAAFTAAVDEHDSRLDRLRSVYKEIEALVLAIYAA